jgi:Zn-dependent protease/co-chaperonin GroES (HSP10)
LVARRRGLPVRSITLFALGGVAQLEKEPGDAKTEFLVSVVGPIASAVIGFVCLLLAWALGWTMMPGPATPLMVMLVWLGYINIGLAIFNMLPGFPMDGGRVLRALVWWYTGSAPRATRAASLTGQVFGFAFIIFGIYRFFGGAGFSGLWMAFIGWFLLNAAKDAYAQQELTERLRGVRVGDLMTLDCTDGVRQSLDVRAGDRVIFGRYGGSEIKLDGEELLIMREDEIFGVVERAGAAVNSGSGKKRGK